jgi:hypothetical protein
VSADDTCAGSHVTSIGCTSSLNGGSSNPLTLSGTTGIGTSTASGNFSIADEGITDISCTATDATSGVAGSSSYTVGPVSTQGAAVVISSGTVCDNAGNCVTDTAQGTFKIDSTAPALAPSLFPSTGILLNQANAKAYPNATDGLSGIDFTPGKTFCAAVDTSSVGLHSVTCRRPTWPAT